MNGRPSKTIATVLAVVVSGALGSTPGCAFAVEHPAVTAGAVAGTLGFATCKLASDDYGACLLVGGGAAALLGLVAAAAIWLGGDGHSTAIEEQAQPLPEDNRPRRRQRRPPGDQDLPAGPSLGPTSPAPANPTSPAPASPTSPAPASPNPASPASPSLPQSSTPSTPVHP